MDEDDVGRELKRIEGYLFDQSNWQEVKLTREWGKAQTKESGVYMLFDRDKPVYVGESGSISGRILDMLDSRHHTVRRSIGEKRFNEVDGYTKATSKAKHPSHIEDLVVQTMKSFKICVMPVLIGRKEFEEYIFDKFKPELNRKVKRKK